MVNSLECEIEGTVLGTELVLECINDHPSLNIYSTVYILCDSIAAIESVTRLSPGVRPQNIKNLVSLHQQLSSLSVNIKLVKILGHTGSEGILQINLRSKLHTRYSEVKYQLQIEGSVHKGSISIYFRFWVFYTIRKISTSPTSL